jgi:phosphatidylglycerol:prolipoprotein diacylglycerol transferase
MFEVGPFALRYYGLFIAIGIVVATWLTGRELERKGMDGTLALDSLFFIVPLGFIGARAYHVATDYELYSDDPFPGVFEVWNGGLGIYGGVIGGFIGLLIFARVRNVNPLALADAMAPGVVLAQAIGRWGNYFNQELFGRPSDLPWAIPAFLIGGTFRGNLLVSSVLALGFAMILLLRHSGTRRKREPG